MNATNAMPENQVPPADAERVNRSSAKCAEYNTANSQLIAAGIVMPWHPTEEVLRRELADAAVEAATASKRALALAVLAKVYGQLPSDVQQWYAAPSSLEAVYSVGSRVHVSLVGKPGEDHNPLAPGVAVSEYHPSSHPWRSSGFRVNVDSRYVQVADLEKFDAKHLNKCMDKFAEAKRERAGQVEQSLLAAQQLKRGDDFLARLPLLAKAIGFDRYAQGCRVNVDGTVTVRYETHTIEQWEQVANLRKAQAAEMEALLKSFAPAK